MKNLVTTVLIVSTFGVCSSVSANGMSLLEKNSMYSQYVAEENLSNQEKISSFKYKGWKALSDNYLIVTAQNQDDYLVETKGNCTNLRNAYSVNLNRLSSMSLTSHGDSITHDKLDGQKCLIKSIYAVTPTQSDALVNIGKVGDSES